MQFKNETYLQLDVFDENRKKEIAFLAHYDLIG
jgi:hypothetical protein